MQLREGTFETRRLIKPILHRVDSGAIDLTNSSYHLAHPPELSTLLPKVSSSSNFALPSSIQVSNLNTPASTVRIGVTRAPPRSDPSLLFPSLLRSSTVCSRFLPVFCKLGCTGIQGCECLIGGSASTSSFSSIAILKEQFFGKDFSFEHLDVKLTNAARNCSDMSTSTSASSDFCFFSFPLVSLSIDRVYIFGV